MDVMRLLNKLRPKKEVPICSAVIVAAGNSTRMGTDKLLMDVGGMPVIARTIQAFQNSPMIGEIIVVTQQEKLEPYAELFQSYGFNKVKKVVLGGKTRTESSLAGVSETDHRYHYIAIHDGARPLVKPETIQAAAEGARDYHAAVPVIPSTDTLKIVDQEHFIISDADRDKIFRVQTPQCFDADIIRGALTKAVTDGISLTDDCSAMAIMGIKTYTVPGDEENIKLTTPADITHAEEILRKRRGKV